MKFKNHILSIILITLIFVNVGLLFAQSNKFLDNFVDFLKEFILKQQQKINESQNITNPSKPSPLYQSTEDLEARIIDIVDKVSPAVVSIVISKYVPVIEQYYVNPFQDIPLPPELKPFFQFEFQIPQYQQKGFERKQVGAGTGFIIRSDGLILTNKHVVNDPKAEYTVYLKDGRKYVAKVLAIHPRDDLAVIKINANNLPVIKLGDSDSIKLGQFAIVIGNVLGEFQNTVTFGVISGIDRNIVASDNEGNITRLQHMIQTDAAINFGNSGGPVLNLRGEVIGIATAMASDAQNVGFAIPINRAKKMLSEIEAKGKVEVPYLGVRYIIITPEIKSRFNLSVDYGAYIYSSDPQTPPIIPNSPAEKIGLRAGDIIIKVDGEIINQKNTLGDVINKKSVGQVITLEILRGDQTLEKQVKLEAMPENLP